MSRRLLVLNQHASNHKDWLTGFPSQYEMHRELLMEMVKGTELVLGVGVGEHLGFFFFFA